MEKEDEIEIDTESEIYNHIYDLMIEQQITKFTIKKTLVSAGWKEEEISEIINHISNQEKENEKPQANNDIFWGGIVLLGGFLGTILNTGYIFYGAMLFGGLLIGKGITNRWDS